MRGAQGRAGVKKKSRNAAHQSFLNTSDAGPTLKDYDLSS